MDAAIMAVMDEELMPRDPDLDDLPDELWRHPGPFTISGVDEDGNTWSAEITKDELAAAFADARRSLTEP
jgi:hypothetical protein